MLHRSLAEVLLAAIACATPQTPAATPELAPPEWASMSRDRLAQLSARIGVRGGDERISAVVSLVWTKGGIVHSGVLGYQDVGSKTPMWRDTIYRIAWAAS